MAPENSVRPPAVAGRFYPDDPASLRSLVDRALEAAPRPEEEGEILGALVPHAGYAYSGPVAARSYAGLAHREFDTAVVLGTAHFQEASGLVLPEHRAFRTPLGEVPVDRELAEALQEAHPGVRASAAAHAREHSIEVQLPFLQRIRKDFKILPLITNLSDPRRAKELGRALARTLRGRKILLILSTDLSHYPSDADGRRVDPASLEALAKRDVDFFWTASELIMKLGIEGLDCAWCGSGAAAVALQTLGDLGADRCRLLEYANSMDAGGDPDRIVGYGAALWSRTGKAAAGPFYGFSEEEKRELLALARRSLSEYLRSGIKPARSVFSAPRLNLPGAVFVTWRRDAGPKSAEPKLLGCMGTAGLSRTVGNAVAEYAILAATEDSRFSPIQEDGLASAVCAVSVLGPTRRATAEEVRPGSGVVLSLGGKRGLFLPDMWEKFGTREALLGALAEYKAGLPSDAWKDPRAEILIFETESFQERAPGGA